MEHKLDDFFRRKTENIEDTLPDNFTFNEQLFWGTLQKNLDKPKSKSWWKWIAVAACLGGLAFWVIIVSPEKPKTPVTSETKSIETPKKEPDFVTAKTPEKTKVKVNKPKKKPIIEPKKDFKIEIEQLAIKANAIPILTPTIKQDSIHFKPIIAEVKPQFKTIHVNEISNTEKAPIPQPKFKIRFAARNQQ